MAPSPRAASNDSKPSADPAMAAAHAAAKGDGLLEALLTELDRSKAQLKMDQVQPPYFIEYRVKDVDDFSAEAAFGALRASQRGHYRGLRVVVRIGDYKQGRRTGPRRKTSGTQALHHRRESHRRLRQIRPAHRGRTHHFAQGRRSFLEENA